MLRFFCAQLKHKYFFLSTSYMGNTQTKKMYDDAMEIIQIQHDAVMQQMQANHVEVLKSMKTKHDEILQELKESHEEAFKAQQELIANMQFECKIVSK